MKAALYFLAGVAIGSAATFLAVKGYLEKKAEQRIEEEVASVKETYLKRAAAKDLADKNTKAKKELLDEGSDGSEDSGKDDSSCEKKDISKEGSKNSESDEELSPDPDDPEEKELIKDIRKIRQSYNRNVFDDYGDGNGSGASGRSKRKNLWESLSNNMDRQDRIDEEFDDGLAEGGPREGLNEKPYPITAEEFANENRHYDKITIFYYGDGTAVDQSDYRERLIDDLDQLIGRDNLRQLGVLADDEGVVLIRNEMRSTDYEIILQEGNYIPDSAPVPD